MASMRSNVGALSHFAFQAGGRRFHLFPAVKGEPRRMTPEQENEWQNAFLHLQGRAGGPPTAKPLRQLLMSGKDVPSEVAFTLARFIEHEEEEEVYVWADPAKNTWIKGPDPGGSQRKNLR